MCVCRTRELRWAKHWRGVERGQTGERVNGLPRPCEPPDHTGRAATTRPLQHPSSGSDSPFNRQISRPHRTPTWPIAYAFADAVHPIFTTCPIAPESPSVFVGAGTKTPKVRRWTWMHSFSQTFGKVDSKVSRGDTVYESRFLNEKVFSIFFLNEKLCIVSFIWLFNSSSIRLFFVYGIYNRILYNALRFM